MHCKCEFRGPDLSSDWNEYSTPEQSRAMIGRECKPHIFKETGRIEFKDSNDFFIASFLVKDILDLKLGQKIKHTPRQDNYPKEFEGFPWNQAHCSIFGDDEERRLKMIQIAKWEIPPPKYNVDNDNRNMDR